MMSWVSLQHAIVETIDCRMFVKYVHDRIAHRKPTQSSVYFMSTVSTTGPTARPTHSFFKLCAHPLDVLSPSFRFLDRDSPAYPFIASKRRNILPFCQCRWVRRKSLAQICWYFVDCARRNCFGGRKIVAYPPSFWKLTLWRFVNRDYYAFFSCLWTYKLQICWYPLSEETMSLSKNNWMN